MGPPPVIDLKPEDIPAPADGKVVLDQAAAEKLARALVALSNYVVLSYTRCKDAAATPTVP